MSTKSDVAGLYGRVLSLTQQTLSVRDENTLGYLALGYVEEMTEFCETGGSELGDVLWFAVALFDHLGYEAKEVPGGVSQYDKIGDVAVGDLDLLKRVVRYTARLLREDPPGDKLRKLENGAKQDLLLVIRLVLRLDGAEQLVSDLERKLLGRLAAGTIKGQGEGIER